MSSWEGIYVILVCGRLVGLGLSQFPKKSVCKATLSTSYWSTCFYVFGEQLFKIMTVLEIGTKVVLNLSTPLNICAE